MNLLVLVGSSRPGSFNAQLADADLSDLPDTVSVTRCARLGELPFYDESIDADGGFPSVVDEFREVVRAADAILVVTPEYNGGMPAVLKNAIDIASRPREDAPIAGKTVAVLAATGSPGGAQHARDAAILALTRARANPIEVTVGIPSAYEAFANGRLIDSALAEQVADLITTLIQQPALV